MTEDVIQRPKARRGGDQTQEDGSAAASKIRIPFSFGRKKEESRTEEAYEPAPAPEPAPEEEHRSYSAAISLAGGGMSAEAEEPSTYQPEPAPAEPAEAPAAASKRPLLPFLSKEETEDRKGTWKDTGYNATDGQAHRDRRYSIPSFLKQTMIVFMVQMKLYSKAKWTYFMLFMAILIPIIMMILPDDIVSNLVMSTGNSNAYAGTLMVMLPIFMGFFTAIMCGPSVAREFKDRTAYMNVSLPLSRASFYFGKYIAGFLMCLGVFMLAYGVSLMMAMQEFDTFYGDLILESIGVMIVALFAFSSTAFCIGAVFKKPSSMRPFMLMTFILPAALILINMRYTMPELMLLPVFLPDVALALMGSPFIGSVTGFLELMGVSELTGITLLDATQLGTMVAIGIVWSIAFLALGLYKTMRREM